jgi:hypothetical protein
MQPKRFSMTQCLKINSACLGACPRDDYNAEFLCTNSCKRKLATCKTKVKAAMQSPSLEPEKTDSR